MNSLRQFWPVLLLLLVFGCKDPNEEPEEYVQFDDALAAFYSEGISPAFSNVNAATAALEAAAGAFADNPTESNFDLLKEELKDTRIAWQQVSPYRFGPAEDRDLHARVNTYPADTAAIEGVIQSGNFDGLENDQRGFAAIAWVLYRQDALQTLQSDANAMDYLNAQCADATSLVDQVKNDWGSYQETFTTSLGASAGSGLSLYLNSFVFDYEDLKRNKLALPLGLLTLGTPLPDRTEAYHAGYSAELAIAHIEASINAFEVTGDQGLDDLLDQAGAFHSPSNRDLSVAISEELAEARIALDQLIDPLSAQVVDDPITVEEVYNELQEVVVLIKADMPSALGVSITFTDNDGD